MPRPVDQVIAAELDLLRPETRADPDALARYLHEDFTEHGASGRIWNRDAVLDALPADPRGAEARDMRATQLSDDVVLVTYVAHTPEGASLRCSVWIRAHGDDWRLRFHQGTSAPALAARTIRAATPADAAALAALMFVHPAREAVAMAGDAQRAERFQRALLERAIPSSESDVVVLERAGTILGFAETSTGGDAPPLPELVSLAVSAFGVVGAARAGWRSWARARVDHSPPPGSLHLVELQVHPDQRNMGIGAELLRHVEQDANTRGVERISLTTGLDNPARRLYLRQGFTVVAEKRDLRYERLTGSPGRVLMAKQLTTNR